MRKFIIVFVITLTGGIVSAQKTALEKVVDSSCKCLNEIKGKIKNTDDFNKLGQGCIMQAAAPHLEEIAKDEGIPLEKMDEDGGEKIGEKIGIKLATSCPAFLELFTQFGQDDEEQGVIKGSVKGTIINVEVNDQLTLTLKDDAGKLTKLTWLTYFEGADEYKTNPLVLKGRKAELNWVQVELYAVKQKDFILVKEITKLSVK